MTNLRQPADFDENNYYDLFSPGPVQTANVVPPPCPQVEKRVVVGINSPHPVERPAKLFPIPPMVPPKHTQIQPRCFTCKHFEMCSFKKDYLKTITLIQYDLGSPQKDYELTRNYITIPGFVGFPMINQDKYLPKEIEFDNSDHKGKLWLSRFNGINYVNAVYKNCKYYILIQLKYNKEADLYELKSCQEAFYKVDYELNEKSLKEIQEGLVEWREIIINAVAPPPPPKPEIINTTHFSADLNCDMYEWNKQDFDKAIENFIKRYPNGIPLGDNDELYHIATYHITGGHVPYAPLYFPREEKPRPKPPKRRDDL